MGHHRWYCNQFSPFSPVLHCPLWPAELQSVHSLMLSSHLFLRPPCLLLPFTVPSKMVLARPDERETWPYHCNLRLFTIVRRSSRGPIACWILARTSSLVTWSLYEMCSILRTHLISMACILLWKLLILSHNWRESLAENMSSGKNGTLRLLIWSKRGRRSQLYANTVVQSCMFTTKHWTGNVVFLWSASIEILPRTSCVKILAEKAVEMMTNAPSTLINQKQNHPAYSHCSSGITPAQPWRTLTWNSVGWKWAILCVLCLHTGNSPWTTYIKGR